MKYVKKTQVMSIPKDLTLSRDKYLIALVKPDATTPYLPIPSPYLITEARRYLYTVPLMLKSRIS